jgi:hypothetical protein
MQRKFTHFIHIPGALSANMDVRWIVPSGCSLVHVSAVSSNDSDALITIGDGSDVDEYLTSSVLGDSQVPAEYDGDDFVDTSGNSHDRYYPHIEDGDTINIAVDYDGDGGTAAEDVTIVLTFVEGGV